MTSNEQHHNALPVGFRLENYRVESVLGYGGFGITYRAGDEDLRDTIAIKEYLPREVAFREHGTTVNPLSESDREIFAWGLERFLDEARTLARFRHPNIVGVRRFIRANGTAYLVMDYCAGESLESVLTREGTLPPKRLEAMLVPLLDALEALHAAGVTHRDIKPGNIYLREDGSPVLLDFGAARQALSQHSRSVTAMATPGYAAFEQYSTKGKQGTWTDIYGLGATLYRCVTGQRPPDASDRMLEDELVPSVKVVSSRYPTPLLEQIDAALRLRPEERPQSVGGWRRSGFTEAAPVVTEDDRGAADGPTVELKQAGHSPRPVEAKRDGVGWMWLIVSLLIISAFVFGLFVLHLFTSANESNIEESSGGSQPTPATDAEFSPEYSLCMDQSGGVTSSMIDCIGQEHGRQDTRLNLVYTALMGELSGERKASLRDAQRAWLKYREANCNFYHDPDGGTAASLQGYDCFMSETATRATELEAIRSFINIF